MKKSILSLLIILLCFCVISCDSADNHPGQAKTPSGSSVMHGQNYNDVLKKFQEKGFTNIKLEKIEDLITGWLTKDGSVEKVTVGGDEKYSPDKWVDANIEVIIYYHTFPSKDTTTATSSSQTTENTPSIILTSSNCLDLASLLLLRDPCDPTVAIFAEKYNGQTIEFNGCILAMNNHGNYTTRYDILIGAGNYDPDSALGPNFYLNNVNATDMKLNTLFPEDILSVGTNIKVTAIIENYNSTTTLLSLKIIKIEVR